MSTTRRQLGTGPVTTPAASDPVPTRLLPVERADVDEHQEHDDPRARTAREPVPGRRVLGGRGR
ncbi:hypothetical protein ABZ927_39070 [Streptomyces massasporeus]